MLVFLQMDDGATKLILQNTDRNANCFMFSFLFHWEFDRLSQVKDHIQSFSCQSIVKSFKNGVQL